MDHPLQIPELEKVRSHSQRLRAESLRIQIKAGLTMCEFVEIEIRSHPGQDFRPNLKKLRHSADRIQFHIEEPQHVPSESKSELRQLLSRLHSRLAQLEKST